jgi:hypothetical protein
MYMILMSKTITINVEEEVETEFRKQASKRYGNRKGYLGKAFTEAMREWTKKSDVEIEAKALKLLKDGIKMKKWEFNRADLYER